MYEVYNCLPVTKQIAKIYQYWLISHLLVIGKQTWRMMGKKKRKNSVWTAFYRKCTGKKKEMEVQ